MEVGLCWYQKGTNNKWTYNILMDGRFETNFALASMTYIVD